jgi:hypothetical protein
MDKSLVSRELDGEARPGPMDGWMCYPYLIKQAPGPASPPRVEVDVDVKVVPEACQLVRAEAGLGSAGLSVPDLANQSSLVNDREKSLQFARWREERLAVVFWTQDGKGERPQCIRC